MIALNNGVQIPKIALGTFGMTQEDITTYLPQALEAGYRHLDMAGIYGNEQHIGPILANSQIPRSELFLTSKVWPTWYRDIKTRCQRTLEYLQVDYLDLYLLHWPFALKPMNPENWDKFEKGPNQELDNVSLMDAWRQMEALVDEGLVKSIGVSNWTVALLIDMLAFARIKPVCNQYEMNVYQPRTKLNEFCLSKEVVPVAYRLVFNPENQPAITTHRECALDNPVVKSIAEKNGCTPGQVCLAWGLAQGGIVIVKTRTRLQENLEAQNVALDEDDFKQLSTVEVSTSLCDPELIFGIPLTS